MNEYVGIEDYRALERRVAVLERQLAEYRRKEAATLRPGASTLVVDDRDRRTEAGLT